jgi:hypothetical protein
MSKIIDINAAYQEAVLKTAHAEFQSVMEGARDFRLAVERKLDTLAEVIPSELTEGQRLEHRARIRDLVLEWLRAHPSIWVLLDQKETGTASEESLRQFLFPMTL